MKPQIFSISDGVVFEAITTDRFKTAQLSVNFLCPLEEDTAALNALIPSVLLRGTESAPTMADINRRLQELYSAGISGTNYKRGDTQVFGLCANFIDSRYALDDTDITGGTLDMLKELLFSPKTENGVFTEAYVDGEKSNQKDKISAQINNKASYALKRCREEMLHGETGACSELGTHEAVDAITAHKLYKHYKSILHTAQILIFYVGPKSAEEMCVKVKEMFSSLAERSPVSLLTIVNNDGKREVKRVEEYESVAQAKLSIGFRTTQTMRQEDYYEFYTFCELYGGGTTAKLFMNVREKLSLCYYCQTVPDVHKGLVIVASGIEADKREEAEREILAQLDEIKNGNITDDELQSTLISLSGEFRRIYDSPDALESWYISRFLAGRRESPEDAAQIISCVTKESLSRAANKLVLDTVYLLLPDGKEPSYE